MNRKPETGNLKPELRRRSAFLTQVSGLRFQVSPRSGLTLIEVMLAVVILGIALVVLVSTAGKCLSIAKKARNYETARELLARLELEHPIKKDKIEDAKGSGAFDSEFSGYRWDRDVEFVGLEDDGLWKVTSTVRWSESTGQNAEELVTYIYAPQDDFKESF